MIRSLIIEDEKPALDRLQGFLDMLPDIEVLDSADSGKIAASLIDELKPDLIFLDIHMEPIDGYEILRILREDMQLKDVLIIAMTASVMAVDVEQLQTAGFSGLLGKPIRNRTFPDMLERILSGEPIWYIS